jgi:hypothetical protein
MNPWNGSPTGPLSVSVKRMRDDTRYLDVRNSTLHEIVNKTLSPFLWQVHDSIKRGES